jgi:type I restriction enzyme S subunit
MLAAACSGRLTQEWRDTVTLESIDSVVRNLVFKQSSTGRRATSNIIHGKGILSVGDPDADAPAGWRWVPLTDVARLESGHTPSRKHPEYWAGDIPWVSLQDARDHHGRLIIETTEHTNALGLSNSAARLLPEGTVCLSRTASVGYVVVMGRPMATSQDFVNWICSDALLPQFLVYALLAEGKGIRRFGRGTTHTTIYYPEVKALHICLPPVREQEEICQRVAGWLKTIEQLRHHVADAAKKLEKATKAVIAKALAGQLDASAMM